MPRIEISERPQSRDELTSWYAAILSNQAASGLSVAEYAGELGVTASTLYQWRRRISAQDGAEEPRSVGLVEVRVTDCSSSSSATPFVVRLGDGCSIEVPSGFDDAELKRLIRTLESC